MDISASIPLQRYVKYLAILDAVLSFITLGPFILALSIFGATAFTEGLGDGRKILVIVAVLIVIDILAVRILMAAQLYNGAKTKDYRKCTMWFLFTIIILLLTVSVHFTSGSDMDQLSFRLFLVEIPCRAFELIVVMKFMRQITKEGIPNVAIVHLNPKERFTFNLTQNSNQSPYTSLCVQPQFFN
ncbi:hypothetical protein Ocin01_15655 [Orchesella cincta]|uniref:Uncharacterized protein n=1 Tax=Orchesella cincta TaxID=48709 RepID=A0A1D2MDD5_ORCCI|nr:hypothetical protein Ocin01_15655 [Orchesella cincta]